MSDARTKEADLAAIKARCELNCTVASHPTFASNPIVIAALANAKASDTAFLAAVAEADAARGFRIWSTYRHVRQACAASDSAHVALRAAIESAEDEHNQPQASHDAASQEPSVTSRDVSATQGILDHFRGKPNTKAVLEEKANVVVQMAISNFDTVPFFANAFVRVGEKQARKSQAETAALLLSLSDKLAFAILGSEDRDVFMGAAEAGVIGALQDKGIAERAAFLDLLGKRY